MKTSKPFKTVEHSHMTGRTKGICYGHSEDKRYIYWGDNFEIRSESDCEMWWESPGEMSGDLGNESESMPPLPHSFRSSIGPKGDLRPIFFSLKTALSPWSKSMNSRDRQWVRDEIKQLLDIVKEKKNETI